MKTEIISSKTSYICLCSDFRLAYKNHLIIVCNIFSPLDFFYRVVFFNLFFCGVVFFSTFFL